MTDDAENSGQYYGKAFDPAVYRKGMKFESKHQDTKDAIGDSDADECAICHLPFDAVEGDGGEIVRIEEDTRVHLWCREDHIKYTTGVEVGETVINHD